MVCELIFKNKIINNNIPIVFMRLYENNKEELIWEKNIKIHNTKIIYIYILFSLYINFHFIKYCACEFCT